LTVEPTAFSSPTHYTINKSATLPAKSRVGPSTPLTPQATITVEPGARTTVTGDVVSGGDTTPAGLRDVPRKFVYTIQQADGSFVDVAYVAYPPSPPGTPVEKEARLDFYAGTVLIGDYMKASGRYDPATNMLIVAEKPDFIVTYPQKP